MTDSSHEQRLVICQLAGYLVASISKSRREWDAWSSPFILSMFRAQFGDEDGAQYFHKFDEKFAPVVGKGVYLWVDEGKDGEDTDFLMVQSAEPHLEERFNQFTDESIKHALEAFVDRFVNFVVTEQKHDARTRTIAKKLCTMLSVSSQVYSEWEKDYFRRHPTAEKVPDFATEFHTLSHDIPRSSLLVPYRMWRVGLVAVGGGAMVGMAGALAAPAIAASLVPLLSLASSFTQLSITLETYLAYCGVMTTAVIPSFFSTYGMVIGAQTMLHRSEELGEMELQPLHISTQSDGQEGSQFALREESTPAGHGPVYILVPGHLDKDVDLRALWGANGSVLIDKEDDHKPPPAGEASANATTEGTKAEDDPTVLQVFVGHEVHELKSKIVEKLQHEVDREIQIFPACVQHELRHVSDSLASQVMHTEADRKEERDWEVLRVKYQGWWRDLVSLGEEYVLKWESKLLTQLNESLYDMVLNEVKSKVLSKIKDMILSYAMSSLYPIKRAFGLPRLVLAKIKEMNGAWLRAMECARQAGILLARVLHQIALKSHKEGRTLQPVTLIGYGMGARLIFHCLEHLHDLLYNHAGDQHDATLPAIIEHAVLMGAPVGTSHHAWLKARKVVAGRLVNCYARMDWILALLYRTKSYEWGVAGLHPVHLKPQPHTLTDLQLLPVVTHFEEREEEQELHVTTSSVIEEEASATTRSESTSAPTAEDPAPAVVDFSVASFDEWHDVQNIDLTGLISDHSHYPKLLYQILNLVKL